MASTPLVVIPQLASSSRFLPQGEGWIYQIKYDGYRMLCRISSQGVRFYSRNGKDWTSKVLPLARSIESLGLGTGWLDGEIAAFDEKGRSRIQRLRRAIDGGRSDKVRYIAFDIPVWAGSDLRRRPLAARLAILERALSGVQSKSGLMCIQSVPISDRDALAALYRHACESGLEGLVAKRLDSPYTEGRGSSWLKIPCRQRDEFVVGGWTSSGARGRVLTGLLLGTPEGRSVRYEGSVSVPGRGEAQLLLDRLHKLARVRNPFHTKVPARLRWASGPPPAIHWVKPELIVEVERLSESEPGSLRHAAYVGIREDKTISDLRKRKPM